MGLTNFPNGITSFGVPVLGSGPVFTTGDTYFVNSAGTFANDSNPGTSPTKPMATLDAAIGRTTANQGDHIIVMPNHAETITGASGITFDVAGVTIIGLGVYNQRPRFLMDGGTAVTAVISAADVRIKNLVFAAGHADIVACLDLTAKGTVLEEIEFADNTTNENWLTPIKATSTTNNDSDGLKVIDCRWTSPDAACVEFIEINADLDDLIVSGNAVLTPGATAGRVILVATGKDLRRCFVTWNYNVCKNTSGAVLITSDTSDNEGVVAHNRSGHLDTAGEALATLVGVYQFDNLGSGAIAASGYVLPAIDS
jgi:hypothetical protein